MWVEVGDACRTPSALYAVRICYAQCSCTRVPCIPFNDDKVSLSPCTCSVLVMHNNWAAFSSLSRPLVPLDIGTSLPTTTKACVALCSLASVTGFMCSLCLVGMYLGLPDALIALLVHTYALTTYVLTVMLNPLRGPLRGPTSGPLDHILKHVQNRYVDMLSSQTLWTYIPYVDLSRPI
jgi:hypothetical protein